MIGKKKISLNYLQQKIISKKNRFKILKKEILEIEKLFVNANVLITGACGSIGKAFTKEMLNFKYKNLYLLDKDENNLTNLNREISLNNRASIKKIKFVCSDITSIDIDDFLIKNKITIYLNFAAVKHVRSEENIDSIKYMLKTNSQKFCPKKKNNLKIFFSVSSDKSVKSTSILGISKYFMEQELANYSSKFPKVFVSSARFANVAFSNGSYLEYAKNRIEQKKTFGLPMKISRYFITTEEAISICLKSILKKNKNKIVIPSSKIIKKNVSLESLINKILNIYNYKISFTKKIKKVNSKFFPVIPNIENLEGQKNFEEFFDKNFEKPIENNDACIMTLEMIKDKNVSLNVKKILALNSKKKIINFLNEKISTFSSQKKYQKVSLLV